jgi:hypothetical protein
MNPEVEMVAGGRGAEGARAGGEAGPRQRGGYSYVYVVRLNTAGKRNEALSASRAGELERRR